MNLIPFAIGWVILAAVVVALAIYRSVVGKAEDDSIHVSAVEAAATANQMQLAKKLESIERWGKILTLVAVLTGLALAAAYIYQAWIGNSQYIG